MSINLISKDFGEKFYSLLDSTEKQINIISPFIGLKTAFGLAEWIESQDNIKCCIITRFNREEFIRGASSIEGLEHLVRAGAELYALQNLHTKLYIFDDQSVIMGSANFTFSGFYKNHEFGLYMENESDFTKQCQDYFDGLLGKLKSDGDWKISLERILRERHYVNESIKNLKGKKGLNEFNIAKWGAVLNDVPQPTPPNGDETDILEDAISDITVNSGKTGIWLKFEGTSQARIRNDEVYLKRKRRINEYVNRTFFPRKPTGIKAGDTIFLTVVSKDKDGIEVPIIIGYAEAKGFIESNKINDTDSKYLKWNNRFPYYIEYTNGKFLNDSIMYGISLNELYRELNHKVYPATVNQPNIKIENIKKRHHQKSHIQITEFAKEYLIKKLNLLFDKHGYEEL
ncbi:phospholipase D family protein [Ureibacillus chungkukjangi]|uniref:Phospholipase D-like protein n=1 Tax=Ureibacillus chungkukjangi TaxID=1202712 RepID=A0A318TU39_9BACL|nr:phospholipase D family protein [Ureibacillus chungkukjangi]PYF07873.1 phospholipase D-like protein [Ureibacillus chungkukjangi]